MFVQIALHFPSIFNWRHVLPSKLFLEFSRRTCILFLSGFVTFSSLSIFVAITSRRDLFLPSILNKKQFVANNFLPSFMLRFMTNNFMPSNIDSSARLIETRSNLIKQESGNNCLVGTFQEAKIHFALHCRFYFVIRHMLCVLALPYLYVLLPRVTKWCICFVHSHDLIAVK